MPRIARVGPMPEGLRSSLTREVSRARAELEEQIILNTIDSTTLNVSRGSRGYGPDYSRSTANRIKDAFVNQHRAMFGEQPRGRYVGRIHNSFSSTYFNQRIIEMGEGHPLEPDGWMLRLEAVSDNNLPSNCMEVEFIPETRGDITERRMHIIHTPRPQHDTTSHVAASLYDVMMNLPPPAWSVEPIRYTYPQVFPESTREALQRVAPDSQIVEVPVEHGTFYQVFDSDPSEVPGTQD